MFNEKAEKVGHAIRSAVVKHGEFMEAREAVHNLYKRNELFKENDSISICAKPAGGKTTLIEYLRKEFPCIPRDTYLEQGMVFVETPASPTIRSVAQELIDAMGGHYARNATVGELTRTLVKKLENSKTKVIVIDEFQHLFERGSRVKKMEVADWFKGLMNRANVSLVIVGLPYIDELFRANRQLRRRTQECYRLNDWSWRYVDDQVKFESVLLALSECVDHNCDTELFSDDKVIKNLFMATDGMIGNLSTLLSEVFREAIDTGTSKIEIGHLEAAFKKKIWPKGPEHRNPFHDKFNGRALTSCNEPFELERR